MASENGKMRQISHPPEMYRLAGWRRSSGQERERYVLLEADEFR